MHAAGTDTCWLGVVTEGRRARYYFFCSLGHGLLLYLLDLVFSWVASWFMFIVWFVESYTNWTRISSELLVFRHDKSNVFHDKLCSPRTASLVGEHGKFTSVYFFAGKLPCLQTKIAILVSINCHEKCLICHA